MIRIRKMFSPTRDDLRRFNDRVDKRGHDECWPWLGARKNDGYGQFRVGGIRHLAHRVSWSLMYGEIPDGRLVLHRCDNPSCVNPYHLYLGDQQDNINDKMDKGRWKGGRPLGSFGFNPKAGRASIL